MTNAIYFIGLVHDISRPPSSLLSLVTVTKAQADFQVDEAMARGDLRAGEYAQDCATGIGIVGKALYYALRAQLLAAFALVVTDLPGLGLN